jgi:hypothetical protein
VSSVTNDETGSSGADFVLYRWFPAAGRFADTFPSRRRVLEALGSVGFVEEFTTKVAQVTAASLRELHGRLSTRADSTLAALDDDTFTEGLEALEHDAYAATWTDSGCGSPGLHRASPGRWP